MSEADLNINQERLGLAVKLTLSNPLSFISANLTSEITIDNLVDIRFKYKWLIMSEDVELYILTRKVKDEISTVKLNVFSRDQHMNSTFSDQWICSGEWSEKLISTVSQALVTRSGINCGVDIYAVASKMTLLGPTLYEDDNFTDFRLSVEGGSVGVHKASLAAHSVICKSLLKREWSETMEVRIETPGASLQTLQALKDFLYLGKLPNTGLEILLQIAITYFMESLKKECIIKLSQDVKPDAYIPLLDFSRAHNIVELTSALLQLTPKYVVQSACELMTKNMLTRR